jgi:hypothetical protein
MILKFVVGAVQFRCRDRKVFEYGSGKFWVGIEKIASGGLRQRATKGLHPLTNGNTVGPLDKLGIGGMCLDGHPYVLAL